MRKIHFSLLLAVAMLSACSANGTELGDEKHTIQQSEDGNTAIVTDQEGEAQPVVGQQPYDEHSPATEQGTETKVDQFIADGFKVEQAHVFTQQFEGLGLVTVTPVTKFGSSEQFPVSLILTGSDFEIVLTPERSPGYPLFSSFEAIAFKDLDSSGASAGFTDIIVIANFITGAGQDGAKPYSDVFLFKHDGQSGFTEDTVLERHIIEAADTRTLTVRQVLDLASGEQMSNDVDVNKLLGTYKLLESNEYRFSEIIIKQVKDNRLIFDLDAYVVRGGKEGLEMGNVNLGTLIDAEAELKDSTAVYKYEDGFVMSFHFETDGTFTITEDLAEATPFGHGVTVSGKYGKE